MKNNCGESVGFSFRAALWFPATVILLCETSVIDFFFVKDQITYFQKRRNLPNLTNGHVAR